MTIFSWLRSITLSCAVTLALIPYASAQNTVILAEDTEMLQDNDAANRMRAAAASCLLNPYDRKGVIALLEFAEWNIGGADDGQWIEADYNDVWVTLMGSNDNFFCNIQGDIPQSAALSITKDMLADAGWGNWVDTPEGDACHTLAHPQGLTIYISSGGNDPVCTPTPHSAISIVTQGD